jgi:O-antigen/teichoic acid export membrane protein
MSYKKFIKEVAIVGFTQILINISGFVLLPVITKTLGAYDYGIWAQLTVTVSLLTALASLALSTALVRFFSSKTDKKEISKGFFSIFFFVTLLSLIIIIILFIFSGLISLFLFNTIVYSTLIQITSFLILLNALYTIVLYYFRIYRKMLIYSGLVIFTSVGQMTLTIFLLTFLGYGLIGIVFSALFSYFVPLVIALGIIIKQVGFSLPSFLEMPKYLKFSLPLAPNSLIYWITDSSDRYIIGLLLGTVSVGVYSAACIIGNLVYFFVWPLQMILFPQLSRLYDNGEIDEVKTYISYSLKFFLLISVPSITGLTVLGKQILVLFTTNEFTNGSTVIPLIALSALFAGLFQIIINITFLYKKTKYNFWIQVFSALSNIALNFILIPLIGIIGAAIATLFSFIMMSSMTYIISKKYLRFKIDIVFISKIILSSILMALIVFLLKEQISLLPQIFIGIVIYFVFCYIFKIFNKQEISFFKDIIRSSKHSN